MGQIKSTQKVLETDFAKLVKMDVARAQQTMSDFENQGNFHVKQQDIALIIGGTKTEAANIMKIFDTDGNQEIDKYEFIIALALFSNGTLDQKAQMIFKAYDFNNSNSVDQDELTVMLFNAATSLAKLSQLSQMPKMTDCERKSADVFAKYSRGNELKISEFKMFVNRDLEVKSILTGAGLIQNTKPATQVSTHQQQQCLQQNQVNQKMRNQDSQQQVQPDYGRGPVADQNLRVQQQQQMLDQQIDIDGQGDFDNIDSSPSQGKDQKDVAVLHSQDRQPVNYNPNGRWEKVQTRQQTAQNQPKFDQQQQSAYDRHRTAFEYDNQQTMDQKYQKNTQKQSKNNLQPKSTFEGDQRPQTAQPKKQPQNLDIQQNFEEEEDLYGDESIPQPRPQTNQKQKTKRENQNSYLGKFQTDDDINDRKNDLQYQTVQPAAKTQNNFYQTPNNRRQKSLREEIFAIDGIKQQQQNKEQGKKRYKSLNTRMPLTLCVKPWAGEICQPKKFRQLSSNNTTAPDIELELDWVYGYRSNMGVNTIKYMSEEDNKGPRLAYFAAAVGVVYYTQLKPEKSKGQYYPKTTDGEQFFFRNTIPEDPRFVQRPEKPSSTSAKNTNGHTDDITCIAFHPNGNDVATGEQGRNPVCYIWNQSTRQVVAKLEGNGIEKNITCLAFDPTGQRIVIIDESVNHNIAVYEKTIRFDASEELNALGDIKLTSKQTQHWSCIAISCLKSDVLAIQDVGWKNRQIFYTVGPQHFRNWEVLEKTRQITKEASSQKTYELTSKGGNFGNQRLKFHSGCVFNTNAKGERTECLTGAITGSLFVWQGCTLSQALKCHQAPDQFGLVCLEKGKKISMGNYLEAICVTESLILTGGKDRKICVLNKYNYQRLGEIDLTGGLPLSELFKEMINVNTGVVCPRIRALSVNEEQTKLAIGFYSSEIYEMDINLNYNDADLLNVKNPLKFQPTKVTELTAGHYAANQGFDNEVWGLDCFSDEQDNFYAATTGHDGLCRVFDLKRRESVKVIRLNYNFVQEAKQLKESNVQKIFTQSFKMRTQSKTPKARSRILSLGGEMNVTNYRRMKSHKGDVDFNHQGDAVGVHPKDSRYIAIGMRDGTLRVYEWPSCKLILNESIATKRIEDLKFSPDGKYLCLSSHDCNLYLLDVTQGFKFIRKFGKSTAYVTHLDWSTDSQAIRTNDASYEVLYYDAKTGIHDPSGGFNYSETDWNTQNCVISWETQGIWQSGMNGQDVNACDVSNFLKDPLTPKGNANYYEESKEQVIACGDDFGCINVYRYPCPTPMSEPVVARGHSSHVTKVEFSTDHECSFLISTGGKDLSVMQWAIKTKKNDNTM